MNFRRGPARPGPRQEVVAPCRPRMTPDQTFILPSRAATVGMFLMGALAPTTLSWPGAPARPACVLPGWCRPRSALRGLATLRRWSPWPACWCFPAATCSARAVDAPDPPHCAAAGIFHALNIITLCVLAAVLSAFMKTMSGALALRDAGRGSRSPGAPRTAARRRLLMPRLRVHPSAAPPLPVCVPAQPADLRASAPTESGHVRASRCSTSASAGVLALRWPASLTIALDRLARLVLARAARAAGFDTRRPLRMRRRAYPGGKAPPACACAR